VFEEVRSSVALLEAAARELDPGRFDGHDAADLLEVFGRGERVCAAAKALLARRVEETKVWREGGHRSAAHWVAETTGETLGAATRTLETARTLEQLPETDAAFRAGKLSETQAAEITSAAGADPSAEAGLLATAAATSVKGLRDECRQVRARAEEDDRAWARRLHASRRAHKWTDPDGAYCASVRMAPEAGARFDAAWEAHTDRIFREARQAGRREPRAAYAADALVALATDGPCKPVEFQVVTDRALIENGHTKAGERCEIPGIGPVPVTTARALLNDARVTVMLRDGDDITAVSSPKRTIPAKLRRALTARYPTCGVKSCANDQFLEIDHVVPLAEGGRTELANAWRICSHHHVLKTYFGWKVVGEPGNWDLVPPDDPDPP
jgi:5-methylcytosine-specific restriction endonuclease McrA